jgi:hypothetical protein
MEEVFESYRQATIDRYDFASALEMSGWLAQRVFARLAAETDVPRAEAAQLSGIFQLVGKLVAVIDPLVDVLEDRRNGTPNPVLRHASEEGASLMTAFAEVEATYRHLTDRIRQAMNALDGDRFAKFTAAMGSCLQRADAAIAAAQTQLAASTGEGAEDGGETVAEGSGKKKRRSDLCGCDCPCFCYDDCPCCCDCDCCGGCDCSC